MTRGPTMDDDPREQDGAAMPPAGAVEISDTQGHIAVDRKALAHLVRRALAAEGVARYAVSIALVDNPRIEALNRAHLGHEWPTDVISFPLSGPDEPVLAGELIVSAEMAALTARDAGLDPWCELALYVVHGLLHLCGYDDRAERDADVMRRREGAILAELGLTNTFSLAGPATTGHAERESAPWPA